MLNLKQNQIFMICESILFLLVTYFVYKYICALNTRVNNIQNRLSMLESFIQQSSVESYNRDCDCDHPHNQPDETTPPPPPQNNDKVNLPHNHHLIQENELINMLEQSFHQMNNIPIRTFDTSHSNNVVEEITNEKPEKVEKDNDEIEVEKIDEKDNDEVEVEKIDEEDNDEVEVDEDEDEVEEIDEDEDEVEEIDEEEDEDEVEEIEEEEDKIEEIEDGEEVD